MDIRWVCIYKQERKKNQNFWFQTRLPLTALPHYRLITACRFRGAALSDHSVLTFPPRDIALKLNRSQLSAVYRCGQGGEVIDWLAWRCSPLGLSSAANGAYPVVQKSPSKQQCGASGKIVWKQHHCCAVTIGATGVAVGGNEFNLSSEKDSKCMKRSCIQHLCFY